MADDEDEDSIEFVDTNVQKVIGSEVITVEESEGFLEDSQESGSDAPNLLCRVCTKILHNETNGEFCTKAECQSCRDFDINSYLDMEYRAWHMILF